MNGYLRTNLDTSNSSGCLTWDNRISFRELERKTAKRQYVVAGRPETNSKGIVGTDEPRPRTASTVPIVAASVSGCVGCR